MTATLILIAAIGQNWDWDAERNRQKAAELEVADLDFQAAVEGFARDRRQGGVPEPYRGLIEALGDDCFKCRELATRRLADACKGDGRRWLFWGRKHRDPEIRARCNRVLKALSPCPYCGGTGHGDREYYNPDLQTYTSVCSMCRGSRSGWNWHFLD